MVDGGIVAVGAGNVGAAVGVHVYIGSKGLQHVAAIGGAQTVMIRITCGGGFCGLSAAGGCDSLPPPLVLGAGLAGRLVAVGRCVAVGVRVGVLLAVGLGPGLAVNVIVGVGVFVADGIGGKLVK